MQWWNDFVDWFYSDSGERVMLGAVVPFVAILVSALIAAAISRGGIKRLMRSRDRDLRASAVTGLIDAARQASTWNSLTPHDQAVADRAASAADVQLRLLPVPGAAVAANWAGHEIRQFKRGSATYTVQFEGPLAEFRDRLIDWQAHPRRARKIFESDLDRWKTESTTEERALQQQQDAWVAQQHADRFAPADVAPQTPVTPSSAQTTAPAAPTQALPSTPSAATTPAPSSAQAASFEAPPAPLPTRPASVATSSSSDNEFDDEPGSVESPTDDSYAPPVSASTHRARKEAAEQA